MKFKSDGVEEISSKIRIFQENLIGRKTLKWDHDLLWKLANRNPIILAKLCTLIILLKNRKISDNYEGSDSYKNKSFWLKIIWSAKVQRIRSMRIKANRKSLQDWSRRRSQKSKEAIMMQEYLQKSSQKKIFLDKYQKQFIIIINYSMKKWPIQERKW